MKNIVYDLDFLIKESENLYHEEFVAKYKNLDMGYFIKRIISIEKKIKKTESMNKSLVYFEELFKLQFFLSILYFKYKIIIGSELRYFVRACERLDDDSNRFFLFQKIKASTEPILIKNE